jgi:hypothetical protein
MSPGFVHHACELARPTAGITALARQSRRPILQLTTAVGIGEGPALMYARRGLNYIACVERDFAIWKELTIDFRGRTVSGSYSTSREGLVTVKTLRGSKIWRVGFAVQSLAGLFWAQKTHRPVRQRDKASG